MLSSIPKARVASAFTDGLVAAMAARQSSAVTEASPPDSARSNASWAPRWAARAKSAGVKPSVRAATSSGSQHGQELGGKLCPACRVGRPHRDDEVEASRSEHRRVDRRNGVRGHDHQPSRPSFECRDRLKQLVHESAGCRAARRGAEAISSASSMKHTRCSTCRRSPRASRNESAACVPWPSRDGWSSTNDHDESRGHGTGERGLACSGRSEEHHRRRWDEAETVGQVHVGQRRDDASFEEVLGRREALHRIPQARRWEMAPVTFDYGQLFWDHRSHGYVEVQPVEAGEALVREGDLADLTRARPVPGACAHRGG